MKRFVFSALAMLLCVFFLFPAGANEELGTWGDFSYALYYNGECGLVFYSGKNWKVSVPEEIDGHRVRDIGSDSFWYARFSTLSISFPEGLESVGEKTFRNLYFFTHVTIPVSSIDASLKALSGCRDHLWVTLRSGENAIHTTAGEISRMDGRLKPLFWGSYTADKTYSFDGKFYAVLSTGRMNGSFRDRAKVTIYRTDTNAPVDSFMPVFSEAFRGMCWEKIPIICGSKHRLRLIRFGSIWTGAGNRETGGGCCPTMIRHCPRIFAIVTMKALGPRTVTFSVHPILFPDLMKT